MLLNILFNSHDYRSFLPFKPQKSPLHFPLSCSHNFNLCTTTSHSESHSDSFTVYYLVNTIGFTREAALRASRRIRFISPEKPNSVFAFFRNQGFSDSSIRAILIKAPWLFSADLYKSILPKLEFFLSKGASISEIARSLTVSPRVLKCSLENRIIPLFECSKRFLKSDKATICSMIRNPILLSYNLTTVNVNLMIDYGVCDSSIARLIFTRAPILGSTDLINSLEEVKGLGFDPSTSTFGTALLAKKGLTKAHWDEKVGVFKKWGWSDKAVIQAFRKRPTLMLASIDKINLVMSFWVNELGWDSLALTALPSIFGYSLQKRLIPRALVIQYLMMKGLRKKNESLVSPFKCSEEFFLRKYVVCFKDESDYLLRLYEENMNLAYSKENINMPFTK